MKLKLNETGMHGLKDEVIDVRTKDQLDKLIADGIGVEVEHKPESEKKLVLLNPEPGTWTTGYKDEDGKVEETSAATYTAAGSKPASDASKDKGVSAKPANK